ncbi:MAG: hypothetical protein GSR85_10070 [Desulfurococcales archaeon]|nr:hypothetical protein [Desulfurococcales archaeon]
MLEKKRVVDGLEVRYFSSITDWEVRRIIELRRRGLGLSRIARAVYGNRGKRYRVHRILKRLDRMGVLGCLLGGEPCCASGLGGDGGHVAPPVNAQHEGDDGSWREEAQAIWVEGRPPRLGKTQKLVYGALLVQGPGGATPSMIASQIRMEHGHRLTRNAVWHALKRLARRGIMERLPRGYYRLTPRWSGILMENLVVRGRVIWSTREYGRPAALEEALTIAALRNRVFPVDRAETFNLANTRLAGKARELKRAGWRMTVVYHNDETGLKAESRFYNPPTPAHPAHLQEWTSLHAKTLCLAKKTIEEALQKLPHKCA